MIGAIIGDIVGSPYEHGFLNKRTVPNKQFPLFNEKSRFTDDSVLTCATAQALLLPSKTPYPRRFASLYKSWALTNPDRGYGSRFKEWLAKPKMVSLDSYANGCMMRCSPIAFLCEDRSDALTKALQSIQYTHNSPEAARGVQSIVDAIHMAWCGHTKEDIKTHVQIQYGHMLNVPLDELRKKASRDIRCNVSAPQALTCFMLADGYVDAIRNAVYIDGDTDTTAAIAGALAEAYYGTDSIPSFMIDEMKKRITPEMKGVVSQFYEKLGKMYPSSTYRFQP